MISINYNRLFNIGFSHNYYEQSKGRSIRLQPTKRTQQKFRDGNMLFKKLPQGITVLYRTGADGTPLVQFDSDIKFTFGVTAENRAEFLNITNLDAPPPSAGEFKSGNVLYFTNDPANVSTDPNDAEMIPHQLLDSCRNRLFTYNFDVSGSPNTVLLGVKNSNGNFVPIGTRVDGTPFPNKVEVVKNEADGYSRSIDLRNHPSGLYTIMVRDDSDSSTFHEEVIYVDEELAGEDIIGVLDIIYASGSGQLYGDAEAYSLQFSRKETIWKYIIVNKNPRLSVSVSDLSISDTTASELAPYSGITFAKVGEVVVNGNDAAVFKSDVAIPFFEIPNANLELINDLDGSTLLGHLPNPSHSGVVKARSGGLESDVYVFI